VDRLTEEIKRDLTLPAEALAESDPPVEHLTSPSIEAYRLYLEGTEYERQWNELEAERCYREAIALDSTFAMAYTGLAFIRFSRDDWAGALDAIDHAVEYADRASERDSQFILATNDAYHARYEEAIRQFDALAARYPDDKEAYYVSAFLRAKALSPRDLPGAIERYLKAIEIDPLFKEAYNDLAYAYDQMGDFEGSIWALDKYIELAPNEPNPYDSRAELYANNGQIEEALQSYLRALDVQPDFSSSVIGAAKMHMFREEYAAAESLLRSIEFHADFDVRSMSRSELADIAIHQGLFTLALERLDTAITMDHAELGEDTKIVWNHENRAFIFEVVDDFEAAVREIKTARNLLERFSLSNPKQTFRWRHNSYEALLQVQAGNDRRADLLLERTRIELEQSPELSPRTYWYGRAMVAFHREQYDTALSYLLKLAGKNPDWIDLVNLGRAYHGARRYRDAVNIFEHALTRYDQTRWRNPRKSVLLHYWLGLTYERSGRIEDAVAQYRRFLHLWRNADPVISEIEDARERLAALSAT
jgi:tetratricopeptide (TPR) repeat protein